MTDIPSPDYMEPPLPRDFDAAPSATPFADAATAAEFLHEVLAVDRVDVAVVLGSGLGRFVDRLTRPVSIPMASVPFFPAPSVPGHAGRIVVGSVGDRRVVVFAGRCHLYEGHAPSTVVHGVRTAEALGARTVLLTNAAGAVNPSFAPGDVVWVEDHLNLTGRNPLTGPLDSLTSRFVDCSDLYSPRLRTVVEALVSGSGVYAQFSGPSYETPAEVRMAGVLGADLVGMSTGLEAIAARHAGMEVAALSLVTNMAAGLAGPLSHDEVADVAQVASERVCDLLEMMVDASPAT